METWERTWTGKQIFEGRKRLKVVVVQQDVLWARENTNCIRPLGQNAEKRFFIVFLLHVAFKTERRPARQGRLKVKQWYIHIHQQKVNVFLCSVFFYGLDGGGKRVHCKIGVFKCGPIAGRVGASTDGNWEWPPANPIRIPLDWPLLVSVVGQFRSMWSVVYKVLKSWSAAQSQDL